MNLLDRLHDFDTLIYTVGDGCPPTKEGVNALSRDNAETAAQLALATPDSLLFIAGGNGGEQGKRGDKLPGSLQEAPRMVRYIREQISKTLPIITDCDAEFAERFGLGASMNTIENGRNAAKIMREGPFKTVNIVAERFHLLRVIGTFRKQLQRLGILEQTLMRAHAVTSEFEESNDQSHITSEQAFHAWNRKANIHHLLSGAVIRGEFLYEILSGRKYGHLHARS